MVGISSPGKEAIGRAIEDMFDRLAMQFIGNIPAFRDKKLFVISSENNMGLPHLFVQAMQNKNLNEIEKDVLRGLLESSNAYIESLKNRTKANVTEGIDALAREAKLQKRDVEKRDVQKLLDDELKKAKSHLRLIAESESTKLRNFGTMMDISRVAADIGDGDPTVFFVIIKDGSTCRECIRLHLMPDEVTPRLWKLSQLKQGYHKRGENSPSAFGLHPHCRCTLTYLSKGFGFDTKGKIKYHHQDYDGHSTQE